MSTRDNIRNTDWTCGLKRTAYPRGSGVSRKGKLPAPEGLFSSSAAMVVVIVSYGAKVTYDINTIKAENDVIAGEIEDLDVKMLSSNTVIYVESQAKEKLGMKSPDNKHCVYLSSSETPEEGFADMLKAKAYN